jgi:hypothetical protein
VFFFLSAGRFGNAARLENSGCTGPCPARSFCPLASSTPQACPPGFFCAESTGNLSVSEACTAPAFYCPAEVAAPLTTLDGFYSVCVDGLVVAEPVCIATAECVAGKYCTHGIARPCPAGRYGDTVRVTNASCSGVCSAGFYCPLGSTGPESLPCSATPDRYCPAASESRVAPCRPRLFA